MTTARPIRNRIDPAASSTATISPQTAITKVLEVTALIEAMTAVMALACLSRSKGKATTEIASATMENMNPTKVP